MSDERVSTWVGARGRRLPFQEFMIVERAEGPIEAVELRGLDRAPPSESRAPGDRRGRCDRDRPLEPGDLDRPDSGAARNARGARGGARPGRRGEPVRRTAVGEGADRRLLRAAGIEPSAAGVARAYAGVIDGIVADEPVGGPARRSSRARSWRTAEDRARLAREVLEFAAALRALSRRPLGGTARTIAILPMKSFGAAKQRLAETLGAGRVRRSPRPCSPTCSARCAARPASTRSPS